MPFHSINGIKYFSFDVLDQYRIKNAIFTRHGGVSPKPWFSLNFGSLVGDDPNRVMENHHRAFNELNCKLETKYDVWQIHSDKVVIAEAPRPFNQPHKKADAIITHKHHITLFMRFADCVPIFVYDKRKRVIGVIHAGWQGTLKKIAYHTIATMINVYQSNPKDIIAGIGPSIGPKNYEVGEEVFQQFQEGFSSDILTKIFIKKEDKFFLDLWTANRLLLNSTGVCEIEMANICTAESNEDWYSHRKENGKTGRFGALITLDQ